MNYKQEHPAGIYEILNTVNQKRYIGSAIDVDKRIKEHKWMLQNNRHINNHLQSAWNTYGVNVFTFELIEIVPNNDWLLEEEQYWIDSMLAADPDFGYNILPIAGSCLGRNHTENTKQRISAGNMGKKHPPISDETRQKMSNAQLGKKRPPLSEEQKEKLRTLSLGIKRPPRTVEHQAKLAASHIGLKHTEETKRKISEAKTGTHYGRGRTHTEETKKKLSLASMGNQHHKGHKHTEEAKQKMAIAKLGKKLPPFSDEHKAKLSIAAKNRKLPPRSDEHKTRLSAAITKYHSEKKKI